MPPGCRYTPLSIVTHILIYHSQKTTPQHVYHEEATDRKIVKSYKLLNNLVDYKIVGQPDNTMTAMAASAA